MEQQFSAGMDFYNVRWLSSQTEIKERLTIIDFLLTIIYHVLYGFLR